MKVRQSLAVTLALRFSTLLTLAVLILGVTFVFVLRNFIKNRQNSELINAASELEKELNYLPEGRQPGSTIPYYITFCIYEEGNEENILYTNDPFLPALGQSGGRSLPFIVEDYFIDGDLNILYFAKEFLSSDSTKIIIQTAMNMDTDSSYLLLKGIPSTIALAALPVLVLCFLLALMIAKGSLAPVAKMTGEAKKISLTNLNQKLSLKKKNPPYDELDSLALTFNELFDRLKKEFDRERSFTSDVSHELKTPLAVILGQTNLLRRWGKDDPAQLEKSLDIIIKDAKSMEAIITNLLQLSRLENGKISAQKESVSLYPLFERLSQEVKSISESAEVIISLYGEDDKGLKNIETDIEMLHQVLTVIISNSIKFCKEKKCIIKILCRQEKEKGRLKTVITLTDNGPGFEESTLDHVFERFYRGDSAHTRSVGGAGLGLSIARALVNALGGTISAANAKEEGAAVSISLY